jgi:hypothetical protein
MDVCVFILFLLSCAGNGLTDLCTRVLPTVYKLCNFRINYEWEQAREPNSLKKKKKKEEEEEEGAEDNARFDVCK